MLSKSLRTAGPPRSRTVSPPSAPPPGPPVTHDQVTDALRVVADVQQSDPSIRAGHPLLADEVRPLML
jgi:hypothetical protein